MHIYHPFAKSTVLILFTLILVYRLFGLGSVLMPLEVCLLLVVAGCAGVDMLDT